MIYRRNEAFRFSFGNPIEASLKILRNKNDTRTTGGGQVMILDLSANGMKIMSPLDFPIEDQTFLMEISFILNKKNIVMIAQPKWKRLVTQSSFYYGLVGIDNEETRKEIIEELKEYSRRIHKEKKSSANK